MNRSHRTENRAGVSVIEVLVVISVLGILMSLLIPAVQRARESSRKASCQNRLRQLGIAFAQVEQVQRAFPTNRDVYKHLLPYIGQAPIYDLVKGYYSKPWPEIIELSCPSETIPIVAEFSQIPNYLLNEGTRFENSVNAEFNGFRRLSSNDTLFKPFLVLNTRTRDITDGLSQTAAMSERLVSRGGNRYLPAEPDPAWMARETGRFAWFISQRQPSPGGELLVRNQCQNHRLTPTGSGGSNVSTAGASGGYNHLLGPNHPACINDEGPHLWLNDEENIVPPSSLHSGGVNVLFADGSVHFIHEQVDLDVWMALGTRSGNEIFQF